MTALQRDFDIPQAPPSEAAATAGAPRVPTEIERATPQTGIVPPWHIRHARPLIAATAFIALAGGAYAGYQAWVIYTNPLDRIMATRHAAGAVIAPPAAALPAPRPAAVTPVVPKTTEPARVVPASPAPRAKTASAVPPVTHTRPGPAADDGANAAPASPASRASTTATQCPAGVVALGLCPANERTASK